MGEKLRSFISKLQDPADRAEMCRRFGIDVVSIVAPRRGPVYGIEGITAVARHDPPPRPDALDTGIITDEASLMAAVNRHRGQLGMAAPAPAPLPEGPADGVIRNEADLMVQVAADRARLGVG